MELVIVAVIAVVVIGVFVLGYNGLVKLRNRVENAWAGIDVQLKRRYDLIPNLVETVKGYASHESETLEAVTQARSQAMAAEGAADKAQAESDLSQALFNLRAVAEQYPDLKASQNFSQLQEELSNTEDRIANARQAYNQAVRKYDTRRQSIPTNIIAGMGNFPSFDYFEADPDSRSPVEVEF
ncbi:LemA family protein [Egibacter rhizosphaerae]|uniref:LemA family protein n=1 Tax=Egibacter rhizosphaerae TaxID=1670831 RepID=A0A411YJV3_9ACTN|nr:LemA family protein [Egibacter rhizosphaerae]QBI21460.1 LemA family protein [Egibacter rhizosphaerae]